MVDAVADMVERHMRFMHVRQMKKSTLRMFMNSPFFRDDWSCTGWIAFPPMVDG